mgnify:CR=1 FL=1
MQTFEEILKEKKFINLLANEAASNFTYLCRFADEQEIGRITVLSMYLTMIEGLCRNMNLENYDPYDKSHCS